LRHWEKGDSQEGNEYETELNQADNHLDAKNVFQKTLRRSDVVGRSFRPVRSRTGQGIKKNYLGPDVHFLISVDTVDR